MQVPDERHLRSSTIAENPQHGSRFRGSRLIREGLGLSGTDPIDYAAFIGRNPLDADNVYIATGDSGNGMTHGTIAGLLLTDLILGRENEWTTLYDPSRKTLRAATDFAKENEKKA